MRNVRRSGHLWVLGTALALSYCLSAIGRRMRASAGGDKTLKRAVSPPPTSEQDPAVRDDEEKLRDRLEEFAIESYGRIWDRDEAVRKSIPVFTAALGANLIILGAVSKMLPAVPTLSMYCIGTYTAALISAILLLVGMLFILRAAWPCKWRHPPLEGDLLEWIEALKAHYRAEGLGDHQIGALVLLDFRQQITTEFAEAATQIRQQSEPRSKYLSYSLVSLLLAALVAAGLGGVCFVRERVYPALQQPGRKAREMAKTPQRTPTKQAAPANPPAVKPPPPPSRMVTAGHDSASAKRSTESSVKPAAAPKAKTPLSTLKNSKG